MKILNKSKHIKHSAKVVIPAKSVAIWKDKYLVIFTATRIYSYPLEEVKKLL